MDHWLGVIVLCLICGGISALIAQRKNRSIQDAFILGALLGIIGLIIVICQKPGLPQAPPGMRAVKCNRCNTVQNVAQDQRTYECWQCKANNELWAAPPPANAARPPAVNSAAQTTRARCHKCQHVQTVFTDRSTFECEGCGARLKRKPKNTAVEGR